MADLTSDEALLIVESWQANHQTDLLNYYGLALLNLNVFTISMIDRDREIRRREGSIRR